MVMEERPTRAKYWAALILVSLTLRLLISFVVFGHLSQYSDAGNYAREAQDLLQGRYQGQAFFWPVGRAICLMPFLLLFGTSETVCKANSVAIDVACVVMAALLGHQVLKKRSTARLVGWIAAFYPLMTLLSGWCYSQNTAMLFLLGFGYLAISAWRNRRNGAFAPLVRWFAAGCSLGLAILSRPSSQSVLALCLAAFAALLATRYVRPRLLPPTWLISWRNIAACALVCIIGVLACGCARRQSQRLGGGGLGRLYQQ
jgi:hypothetical protein